MRRGFTLIELMVATALLAGVTAVIGALAFSIHHSERQTGAYVRDITELRRAVRAVERDLRAGEGAAYRLEGHVLFRGDDVVARRIGLFEMRADGAWTESRIGLVPRRDVPTAERAAVTVRVRRRR